MADVDDVDTCTITDLKIKIIISFDEKHRITALTRVYQGDVESIAQKSAKQLTTLFESISGSEEIIPQYDLLKEAKEKAQQQHQLQQHKRKVCIRKVRCILCGITFQIERWQLV